MADDTMADDTMAKRFKYRANLKPNCFFEAFRKKSGAFFKPFPDKWDRLGIKWRWLNAKLTFMPIFAMARKRVASTILSTVEIRFCNFSAFPILCYSYIVQLFFYIIYCISQIASLYW